ncbi:MAG: DUF1579 domain-containing protein [Planctomycetes bacterium]|nr:DUF1579 domain-containing protein [Planctomycetota bacterium]
MKSHKQLCALSCAFGALISGAALSTFGLARAPQGGGSTQTAATNQAPSAAPATQPAVISDAKARALLGLFVGSWEVRGTTVGVGGASTGPFQGQCHFNWTLGGVFLAGDHVLYNQQGAALQMMDVMGFTPGIGFTRSEITNGDRSMFLSTGMYDDAPNALVFASSNPMVTPGGKQRSLDTSFLFRPDGTIVWNTTFEEEDSPVGTVKLVLTRMETPPSMQAPTTPFGAPMIAQGGAAETTSQQAAAADSKNFIVQTPQGLAVTRAPQSMEENKQLLSAMLQQRQQLQAQMNAMQGQVQDMSRMMTTATSP